MGRKGKINQLAPPCPQLETCPNPGMCPDWESNQQPFRMQASAQSTKPHPPGLYQLFKSVFTLADVAQWTECWPMNCKASSQSGHRPGLQARSPAWGVRGNRSSINVSLTH